MPTTASTLAAAVLACAFAWAAAAKLVQFKAWGAALDGYRIPRSLHPVALVGLPVAEIVVTVLLLAGPLKSGAALAVALVAVFSMAIIRARSLQGDKLPCGCFGRTEARDYRLMLIRNGVLAALAAAVLLSGTQEGVVQELSGLSIEDVLPVTLVGLGLILSLWMVRQVANAFRGRQS